MPITHPEISKRVRESFEIQEFAKYILESEGYQIIAYETNDHRKRKIPVEHAEPLGSILPKSADYFCMKNNSYFVFDIKYKESVDSRNNIGLLVTGIQIHNFNAWMKKGKVSVKIMIVFKKNDSTMYRIYDWNDFLMPNGKIPNDCMAKTIKLKDGFDPSTFKKFKT